MAALLRDIDGGTLKPIYNYPRRPAGHGWRRRCRSCRAGRSSASPATTPASTPAAAARSSAASAPSSTCRAASRASARPTTSRDRARERRAGHHALLRHRRQFRAQPQLGADPRSADRVARAQKASRSSCSCRSTRSATASPDFIEKAARAGCTSVFIGLENINPESLMGTKKRQNKIWEYREMLQAWRSARVLTYAGYILGFPTDTPEIDRARHRDHQDGAADRHSGVLLPDAAARLRGPQEAAPAAGVPMDPDMNNYDLEHVCTAHPRMSKETWQQVYCDAWARYYTDEHVETVMRRGDSERTDRYRRSLTVLTIFSGSARIEDVHPLQFGFVRRKVRTQRRHGMPIVNPLIFYPWRAWDVFRNAARWGSRYLRHRRIMTADPRRPLGTGLYGSGPDAERGRSWRRPVRAGLC